MPDTVRQLDLWEHHIRTHLRDRVHHRFDEAMVWLRANVPTSIESCLNWGDGRLGNIIWREFRKVCATDFEAAAVAPPEMDLGWWLMFDRSAHEAVGIDRLLGEPTRDEQRAHFSTLVGRHIGDTTYWEVFAAVRYLGTTVSVLNRLVDRGEYPADHTHWLANPASSCLEMTLPPTGYRRTRRS